MTPKTLTERFSAPKTDELNDEVKGAIQAMNRAGEKLRKRKKALGHKLVVWKEGKVCIVEP